MWYDVAENSPPDEDDFLKENPGIIPTKVAELLTVEERKEAIEKLKAHKEENPAAPPDQDEDYSGTYNIKLTLQLVFLARVRNLAKILSCGARNSQEFLQVLQEKPH